jgi:hypothetical protein
MKALLQVWNECEQEKSKEIDDPYRYYKDKIGGLYRFAALCLFAPCTMLQFTTNDDGANSTKPLLAAGTVNLAET